MVEVNCGNWKGSDTEIFQVEKGEGRGCALVIFLIVGLLFMAAAFFLTLDFPTRIICGFFGFTLVVIAISSRSSKTRWSVFLDKEKQQMRFSWDSADEIYCVPFAACRNIVLEKSFLRSHSTETGSDRTSVTWYFEFYLALADGSRFLIDQTISTQADPPPDEIGPTAELLSSFTGLSVEDLSDNGLDIAGTARFGDYRDPEPPAPGRFVYEHISNDEAILGIRQSKRLLHQLPAICVLVLLLVPVYWLVGEMLDTRSFAFLFAIPILILLAGIALFWFIICREIRQRISLRSDEIALEMSLGVKFLPESVMVFPRHTRLSVNIARHEIEGIRLDRRENTVDLAVGVDGSVRKALLAGSWPNISSIAGDPSGVPPPAVQAMGGAGITVQVRPGDITTALQIALGVFESIVAGDLAPVEFEFGYVCYDRVSGTRSTVLNSSAQRTDTRGWTLP